MERRYIARVVGVKPEIVETRTDYLVAIPRFRKAFMVTVNPMAEAAVGRTTALAMVKKARTKDVPVFRNGRCIVYVFSDAWESEALVDRVADVVAESQISGLVQPAMCSALERALRAAWGWVHGLIAGKWEPDATGTESVEVRAASAPIPADSGDSAEQVSADAAPEDKVPA